MMLFPFSFLFLSRSLSVSPMPSLFATFFHNPLHSLYREAPLRLEISYGAWGRSAVSFPMDRGPYYVNLGANAPS